jgi:ABC-type glycerol-3-phosphate transport system substrate-binding protein
VNRRKIALIFLPLFLLILILSPWASAPAPTVETAARPVRSESAPPRPPADEDPVTLSVAAALDEAEYVSLERMAESLAVELPNVRTNLVRVDPETAVSTFSRALRLGDSADILLMDSAWVRTFAVSGYLAPADGVYSGDPLSEPVDAVSAPLKWNGYWWGAPRDYDPYVLLWNADGLKALQGEGDLPRNLAEWTELAAESRTADYTVHWLALDTQDPLALLFWLEAAAGQRTDTLWEAKSGDPWSGTPAGEALALLDRERAGVLFAESSAAVRDALLNGQAAGAVLPYSEARRLASLPASSDNANAALTMDRSAWKLPYVWFRGTSYAITSAAREEEAARRWIAAMTSAERQEENWESFGKLPVSKSFYQGGDLLSLLPGGGSSASFPFQPPVDFDPGLPERLERLTGLWREFAFGSIDAEEWVRRWSGLSADLELHD